MSNPAVFELSKIKIDGSIVCIEDNIGEAIHIHIGAFRIDLTIKEFIEITGKLEKVLDFLLKEKSIDISEYDPYFILYFCDYWLEILKVEERKIRVSDLKVRYINKNGVEENKQLIDSPFYRYYQEKTMDLEIYENMLDIFQTNKEKADISYKNILEQGYPSNNYIVINKDGYILDGEEKACSLLSIYGQDYFCDVKVFILKEEAKFGRKLKEKKW